jgi:hypothetical protein
MRFLDPYAPIVQTKNRLPHWTQAGATYFVTFHAADSIPRETLRQWSSERDIWLNAHPQPWSSSVERENHLRFSSTFERWLDESGGKCVLRNPANAALVAGALMYFDPARCVQHAWVVMPNHVHSLVSLGEDEELEALLGSWKKFTARRISNRIRGAAYWQKDYFDRLIRDDAHFWNCARYVRRNPAKAKLTGGEYLLWESEYVRETLDAEDERHGRPPSP